MIIRVVNKKNKVLGYVFDSCFIPYDLLNNVCSVLPKSNKTIQGVHVNNSIVSSQGIYEIHNDYLLVLRKNNFNLSTRDICFIECMPSKDEFAMLSSFWSIENIVDNIVYAITDSMFNTLGFLATNVRIKNGCNCYICMFEIFNKNKGVGARVMTELLKRVSIKGILM